MNALLAILFTPAVLALGIILAISVAPVFTFNTPATIEAEAELEVLVAPVEVLG